MSEKGSSEWRIVLLGKTGAGKSATGNTILGRDCFKSKNSPSSVTDTCYKVVAKVFDRTLSVIDTPGLFDTSMTEKKLKTELEKCICMSAPGPHVFLLVIRLDVRLTKDEIDAVQWIQQNFGKDASRYILFLFTHADILEGRSLDDFIKENRVLKTLIENSPYHSFSNNDRQNKKQVEALLEKLEEINKGTHYTNEMYKKAQRKIKLKKGAKICGIAVGATLLIGATGGAGVAATAAIMGAGAVAVGAAAVGGAAAGGAAVGAGAAAGGAAVGAGAAAIGGAAALGGAAAGGAAVGAGAAALGGAAAGGAAVGAGAAAIGGAAAVGGAAALGGAAAGGAAVGAGAAAIGGAAAVGGAAAGAATVGGGAAAGAAALGATALAMGAAAGAIVADEEDKKKQKTEQQF